MTSRRPTRVALAVIDQGLFSGASFLTAVLFARWMTAEQFGSVAVGLSISLLLSALHGVVFLEPVSIFGAARYSGRVREYMSAVTRLNAGWAVLAFVASGIGSLGVFLLGGPLDLSLALLGVGASQGAMAWAQSIRRVCYVCQLPGRAAALSTMYLAYVGIGAWILEYAGSLNSLSAFLLLATGSAAAGAWGYAQIPKNETNGLAPIGARAVLKENVEYGRLLLVSAVLQWTSIQAYFVIAGGALSIADAGTLKALQNLVSPVGQLMAAFGLLFLPYSARVHANHGLERLVRETGRYSIWLFLLAVGNLMILFYFGSDLVRLVYGDQYRSDAWLVAVIALMPIVTALTTGWVGALRILGRTTGASGIDAAGALFTLIAGPVLIIKFGLAGAVWGMVVSSAIRVPLTALNWIMVYRDRNAST